MSLADFFEGIAPVMLGNATAASIGPVLGIDAGRLGIYERFCRTHRLEAIEGVFPHCHDSTESSLWAVLVEDYFQKYPMRHVEVNTNAAQWPDYLRGELIARSLPIWLPELADLEWWEWQILIAPDDESDPKTGSLRLAQTLEIRPYAHDIIAWLENERQGEPAEGTNYVLFWRDEELDLRRESASELEMLVLKSVATNEPLAKALLKKLRISRASIDETIADLCDAGILHGE